VTAVGGTSIAIGAGNQYLFETVGHDPQPMTDNSGQLLQQEWRPRVKWTPKPPGVWIYGSGGGVSRIFAEPSYQSGVVRSPYSMRTGRVGHAVPDISAPAMSTTGYLIGQTQQFSGRHPLRRVSHRWHPASPRRSCRDHGAVDQARGSPHGFANPALYAWQEQRGARRDRAESPPCRGAHGLLRTSSRRRADFSNTLRTMDQDLSLRTTGGWDDVTGIGTPTSSFRRGALGIERRVAAAVSSEGWVRSHTCPS